MHTGGVFRPAWRRFYGTRRKRLPSATSDAPIVIVGPYRALKATTFRPGAVNAETFSPGATKARTYKPGGGKAQ